MRPGISEKADRGDEQPQPPAAGALLGDRLGMRRRLDRAELGGAGHVLERAAAPGGAWLSAAFATLSVKPGARASASQPPGRSPTQSGLLVASRPPYDSVVGLTSGCWSGCRSGAARGSNPSSIPACRRAARTAP